MALYAYHEIQRVAHSIYIVLLHLEPTLETLIWRTREMES